MAEAKFRIEPLTKVNYDTWRIHAKALLIKTDGWQYVNGAIVKPEPNGNNDFIERAWEIGDQKAFSDLMLSISSSELKQVQHCKTSRELWTKLQNIYESKGPARKANLIKKLIRTKLKDEEDIKQFLDDFFDTRDKLSQMNVEVSDDMISVLLLDSLPECFENFRCAIETRDELPAPEIIKIKIIEEFQARLNRKEEISSSAMLIRQNNQVSRTFKGQNQGEKPFLSNQRDKSYGNRPKFICFRCKKPGHKAAACLAPKPIESDSAGIIQALALQNKIHSTSHKSRQWCLDSGATSHMKANAEDLQNFKQTNQSLSLANN